MSLAELRRAPKESKTSTNGSMQNSRFSAVQEKINQLTLTLQRLEDDNNRINKQKYQEIQTENEALLRSIEDELNRDVMNDDEEVRTFVLRHQKVLTNLKKKLQKLMETKKSFIEEENGQLSDDDNKSDDGLLGDMQIESYEDYIQKRDQRIKGIHKDLGIVHNIISEMKTLAGQQSGDLDIVLHDVEKVEANTEKSNKELSKANAKNAKSYKALYKMIAILVLSILLMIYLIIN